MNSAVRYARHRAMGMGALGDESVYQPATRPRTVGSGSGSGDDKEWWELLIGAGTSIANTYLVTRPTANPYALPGAQPAGVPVYNAQPVYAAAPAQQIGQGIGDGFANFAAQFGVTPVTLVILGIIGFYLFTRNSK
jgi:hypothetical protein